MIAQLRSELRKMATTRTNLGLLLGLIALVLFGVIAGKKSFGSEADFTRVENQQELIGNGAFGAIFAALIGVMAMTSEFRHGTIRATLSSAHPRSRGGREGIREHAGRNRLRHACLCTWRRRGRSDDPRPRLRPPYRLRRCPPSGAWHDCHVGTPGPLWESALARWSAIRCSPSSDCLPGCLSSRCSSSSTCPGRAGTRRARLAPR